ncbi:hypothetical protein WJX84_006056 [Apatococcus fuscideae]|uniref:G-patch domain-containing protein n=1 Tax=Apatococcus fuscideae TaxID=2026836 RepID=A0AAW1T2X6_9CHLO
MVAPDEALFGKKYQGVEKRSTGYKLLAAMGWKEGEGLGATKQGIKEHVRVRKKADTIGVGLKEAAEHSKDWKIGMVAFDHVLSALKEVRAQHDKDQHGQSTADSDSSSSEEEEEEEAPAAPPPKKKARVQPAAQPKSEPVRRKSKMKAVAAAESTADEVSMGKKPSKKQKLRKDTQQAAAAAAAAAAAKNPTHLGRFARREAGKRVKGYSATDLAAILGGGASDAPPKAAPAAEPATLDAPEQPAPSSDASEETALEGAHKELQTAQRLQWIESSGRRSADRMLRYGKATNLRLLVRSASQSRQATGFASASDRLGDPSLPAYSTGAARAQPVMASAPAQDQDPYAKLKVSDIQRILDAAHIDYRDCFEREQLLQRLRENAGRLGGSLSHQLQSLQRQQPMQAGGLSNLTAGQLTAQHQLFMDEQYVVNLFQANRPSVVHITSLLSSPQAMFSASTQERPAGQGSGFIWDTAGHVVTNFHAYHLLSSGCT